MYILDKLHQQIDSLKNDYFNVKRENQILKDTIDALNNNNDQMQFNNENMLLNIDKALHITSTKINEVDEDEMKFEIQNEEVSFPNIDVLKDDTISVSALDQIKALNQKINQEKEDMQ